MLLKDILTVGDLDNGAICIEVKNGGYVMVESIEGTDILVTVVGAAGNVIAENEFNVGLD
jgi:hypothetical protein